MMPIEIYSPQDGRLLGSYQADTVAQIAAKMAQARIAATVWSALPVSVRGQRISALSPILLAHVDEIVAQIVAVTGKAPTEALLAEIYPLLDMLDYYRQHAPRLLAPEVRQTSPWSFPDACATVYRQPFGVVAVLAPWNLPFQLALTPVISALLAGNSVLLKPSELSLPIGDLIAWLLARLDLPAHLVQIIYGNGETGQHLIDAAPDLVCFTGSAATGRKVMARAAQHPVPVILELGGNDAMLVFADANMPRAVNAALYGAFSHSGQLCVAVERCYVEQASYTSRGQVCGFFSNN